MKYLFPDKEDQSIIYVNNIRELNGVKGLSYKRLCIVKTNFKDINKIKKFCKSHPNLEVWLASENISKQNMLSATMCGAKNVIEYPLKKEVLDDILSENQPQNYCENLEKDKAKYLPVKGLKVMIVDDNPLNIELLVETLKELNLNIVTYKKSKDAAKAINNEKFDLFLLDIMMPEVSGFDLAELIKKSELNTNTPIIFISALSDTEHKIKSYDIGSYAYIEKPFNIKVVKSQIFSLLKAHSKIEKKFKMKDSYLAMVTHDMKGPVQAEMSALKLMLALGKNLDNDQKEILEDLLSSVKYLQNLVVNVLQKYKSDNGNLTIAKASNSFKNLIIECCDEIKYLASEKGIQVNVFYKSNIEYILFDYEETKRVIHNLLTNALKYSFKNKPVFLNVEDGPDYLIVSVKNFGIGVELENQQDVFNKFTSYCEEEKSVNSGLGLYISKQIIEAQGGTIKFESIPNCYTTVTFTLPIN